jgi:hypothetical protein
MAACDTSTSGSRGKRANLFLEQRVHPVLQAAFNAAGATLPPEPARNEMELVDVNVFPRTPVDVA